MLKFFRKIRYNLMNTGKTSKYFKYAIGEIILVVIGILIALQINNWNEQAKANALEDEYYCRLFEDIQQDKIQFDALKEQAQNRLKSSNEALRLLLQDKANSTKVAHAINMAINAVYIDFRANNSTFEDLKSSNLNIIKDKSLINDLNTYYNSIESLKSIIMVNGKSAVDTRFANNDMLNNGNLQASVLYGRLKKGMDKDILNQIVIDTTLILDTDMKKQLYNESLLYTERNIRQIELYEVIQQYTEKMNSILKKKCMEQLQ